MGASRRRLPLSLILILLTALIAGALGQQEECDTLGKSEAVDEAEPHRHAGARTCPGRSVGRAAGVSGRAQGCAGVYPSGANPDQPADRAPAPARAREDSIRLDFCKQKSVNKVRVEIGTQAGALVFHIAMEDVFMWSRKARQFLNKCRDFMAVTDDVRPAGLPRPAEAMDMLFDAYRDENGVNRCERISSGKRCIIDESMTLHQSLEVALWAEPECSRGMEMKRKICECSCWSSIVDVYGPMLEQWGGYDGQVAIKKQELEDLCKQGLVSDFNGEFRESSSTQCGSNEITVEITPQTDGGLPAGTFFTIAGLNGEPHGSMQLNAISSSFLGQLKWDPASCSQWCSKSGMCPSSGNAKDSSCLSRPIAESDAADTVEGASGAITTSEAITSNRCVRWCDKDGKLTVKVLRSMPSNTKVVISVTMLNPTFSQASRPLVVSASGSGFYLKPRAIEAFSGAKSVLTAADMPMFTTFEINEDPCNGVFDPKSRVWRGSCAGMVNTLRFTVNPNLEPHGGSQILIRGLVRSDSAKLSPPTLRDMDGTLNGLSIDQWDSSTGTLTLRVTAGDGASQDPVVPVGNTSKFALDFEMPSSADDAPLPSDKGKKITVEVLRAGPQLNCQFHTAEYYFPNALRSKVPDEKSFETRKVGTSTCSPGECNTISVTFASNRLIREASDEVILVITGLKGMDNSLVCNPSTSCGDPDVNSIPLSDVKSGSNDKNLFQSLSKNTGLATWNAAVGSLAMNLAPGAELHPYKNYAVSFKLKNGYEKTVLNDIRISAYLKGACMRSSASSSSSAVSPVASKYSTSALAPCAGEQMEQTQSGGVVVCNPAFTVKTIGQTYPWPGCDGASNYIQVTLVPNVKIEYPAVIHLLHFIGPSDVEVFPTVNVSGVVSVSKNATIRYGVTHADKNSSNTSFLWSDSSDKVTLPLWAGYPLIAGDEYVFAFGVRNPKATQFVGSQAPISIQVRGPIFNISMPLDHNLTAVPIETRTFPGDAAALRVNAPAFVQKIIGQSNPYPDALNTLTVTLVPNIAMGTESPNNSSHLTSEITLSGLISTETHSSTLAITQSSPSSSVLNSNATWSRQDGKLVVSFKNLTKWRTSDAAIIFSFQIKNPGICQSSPDVMVSATSEGTNCPREIQVASMDKDAVTVPFSTCRACGAVGDHCNACDKCDQLCDDADASSLKVHSPAFIIKEVQQETTWPGAENKFNVSFAANIDFTGNSAIFLSGFVGGTAPNGTLNLTAGASLFDAVEWHNGDKVLYLNVASAGITAGTTNTFKFKLTNPLQAQRAPLIMIWALNAGSCLKPVPKCTMDRPTTTSLQPLTVDPKFFTARAIGQSSPFTPTQSTITATLATNFALERPTKVTLMGLIGSTIEDNLALKVTTVAGGNLFETTGIWTRGTGTLVPSLIESASSVPGQNYTISIDLMNPPAAQNNPLVSVTANDVDAVQTRSWPNANLPAGDQLPMKVIKPRIVTAKISQSSAFPGARNVITVTLRMIQSTSKGSFTITGLMGAQRRTGPIALQSPASCNGTATVLTALPSGTSCMNIFKSSPTGAPGTGWWQGHSNQGEDAQEGSMPQALVLFVANGINANVDYVFSFDVQNPTCNHECSTVSIIANGLDFVPASCGGEINSFIASPVASKTAVMQDMSTSTSCAGLVHAPNFNVKTITECSTVNGDPNAITVILSPNVDLKQGSILSIFGLTGSNTDAPTLEIEGPDSTLFSEVMWSKREGELKMKIRDVSGISMGQTVVFSFSLQNPSNQVTPKEPTVGVESEDVIIGDSVMSGLVLGAGDRPFFNLASISESTSVQRTYNTLTILINSNSRIPTSSKITLTGLKGTLPMTESGQIAGMHPFYFGSNPLWNHASGTLVLEVVSAIPPNANRMFAFEVKNSDKPQARQTVGITVNCPKNMLGCPESGFQMSDVKCSAGGDDADCRPEGFKSTLNGKVLSAATKGKFMIKSIGQQNPYPGEKNTLTVTLASSVEFRSGGEDSAMVTLTGLRGATVGISKTEVKLAGAHPFAQGSLVAGNLSFRLVADMIAGRQYVFSIDILNPLDAAVPYSNKYVQVLGEDEVQIGMGWNGVGATDFSSMTHDLTTVPKGVFQAKQREAAPLTVRSAEFQTKTISQSSPYPCDDNWICATLVSSVPLSSEKESMIRISTFKGATISSGSGEISLYNSSGGVGGSVPSLQSATTNGNVSKGFWNEQPGGATLIMYAACRVEAGTEISMCFKVKNPIDPSPKQPIKIFSSDGNLEQDMDVKSTANLGLPYGGIDDAHPMYIRVPRFEVLEASQASPFPADENLISITLKSNVPFLNVASCKTVVTVTGLRGSITPSSNALVVNNDTSYALARNGVWEMATGTFSINVTGAVAAGEAIALKIPLTNRAYKQDEQAVLVSTSGIVVAPTRADVGRTPPSKVLTKKCPFVSGPNCGDGDQAPMYIYEPEFLVAEIRQTSNWPGASNTLTIEFVSNAKLDGHLGNVTVSTKHDKSSAPAPFIVGEQRDGVFCGVSVASANDLFILYSEEHVRARFGQVDDKNAEHFACVKAENTYTIRTEAWSYINLTHREWKVRPVISHNASVTLSSFVNTTRGGMTGAWSIQRGASTTLLTGGWDDGWASYSVNTHMLLDSRNVSNPLRQILVADDCCVTCNVSVYVQIDLGENKLDTEINRWLYGGVWNNNGRQYCGQKAVLSTQSDFSTNTTVFACGTFAEWMRCGDETRAGKPIRIDPPRVARYVRYYTSRSTVDSDAHFTEIRVRGTAYNPTPLKLFNCSARPGQPWPNGYYINATTNQTINCTIPPNVTARTNQTVHMNSSQFYVNHTTRSYYDGDKWVVFEAQPTDLLVANVTNGKVFSMNHGIVNDYDMIGGGEKMIGGITSGFVAADSDLVFTAGDKKNVKISGDFLTPPVVALMGPAAKLFRTGPYTPNHRTWRQDKPPNGLDPWVSPKDKALVGSGKMSDEAGGRAVLFLDVKPDRAVQLGERTVFSFYLLNPVQAQDPQDFKISAMACKQGFDISAESCPQIKVTHMAPRASEPSSARALGVVDPKFLVKKAGQTSPFPCSTNILSITLSSNIHLRGRDLAKIIVTNFDGAIVGDTDTSVSLVDASGGNDHDKLFKDKAGLWKYEAQGLQSLELKVHDNKNLIAGRAYRVSFEIENPTVNVLNGVVESLPRGALTTAVPGGSLKAAWTAPTLSVQADSAALSRKNILPAISFSSDMDKECASLAMCANTVSGDASPLFIYRPAFTRANISQSSAFHCQENIISVTIAANVPLCAKDCQAQITIKNLNGAVVNNGDIQLLASTDSGHANDKDTFAASPKGTPGYGKWMDQSLTLFLTCCLECNKEYRFSFKVTNQNCFHEVAETITIESSNADNNVAIAQTPMDTSQQQLTLGGRKTTLQLLKPKWTGMNIGQSSSAPCDKNTITATLATNVPMDPGTLITLSGITNSQTNSSRHLAVKSTLSSNSKVSCLNSTGVWDEDLRQKRPIIRQKGTLVVQVAANTCFENSSWVDFAGQGCAAYLANNTMCDTQAQRWTMTLLFVLVLAVAAIGAATTFSQCGIAETKTTSFVTADVKEEEKRTGGSAKNCRQWRRRTERDPLKAEKDLRMVWDAPPAGAQGARVGSQGGVTQEAGDSPGVGDTKAKNKEARACAILAKLITSPHLSADDFARCALVKDILATLQTLKKAQLKRANGGPKQQKTKKKKQANKRSCRAHEPTAERRRRLPGGSLKAYVQGLLLLSSCVTPNVGLAPAVRAGPTCCVTSVLPSLSHASQHQALEMVCPNPAVRCNIGAAVITHNGDMQLRSEWKMEQVMVNGKLWQDELADSMASTALLPTARSELDTAHDRGRRIEQWQECAQAAWTQAALRNCTLKPFNDTHDNNNGLPEAACFFTASVTNAKEDLVKSSEASAFPPPPQTSLMRRHFAAFALRASERAGALDAIVNVTVDTIHTIATSALVVIYAVLTVSAVGVAWALHPQNTHDRAQTGAGAFGAAENPTKMHPRDLSTRAAALCTVHKTHKTRTAASIALTGGLLAVLVLAAQVVPARAYACTSNAHCQYSGCGWCGDGKCRWRGLYGSGGDCPDPPQCVAGKYSGDGRDGGGNKACSSCPAGKYSPTAGASSCAACGAGKYSPTAGASSCTACVAGKYSPMEGAASESSCTACVAGKYSTTAGAASESSCAACVAGKYSPTAGATTCRSCVAGKYSVMTEITEIKVGDVVVLQDGYAQVGDAGRGPLKPGAAGTVVEIGDQDFNNSNVCPFANDGACDDPGHTNYDGSDNQCFNGTDTADCNSKNKESKPAFSSSCRHLPDASLVVLLGAASEICQITHTNVRVERFSSLLFTVSLFSYFQVGSPSEEGHRFILNDGSRGINKSSTVRVHRRSATFYKVEASGGSAVWWYQEGAIMLQTKPKEGATVCTNCVAGKYGRTEGASDTSDCADCVVGKYSLTEAQSVCIRCAAGKYAQTAGASACTSCECPPGQVQNGVCGNSSRGVCETCSACPPGENRIGCVGTATGSCVACDAGKYKTTSSGITACQPCEAVPTCPSASYRTGCGGSSEGTCADCGGCAAGEYRIECVSLSPGQCTTCALGSYKTSAGSEPCVTCGPGCEAGKYQSGCSPSSGTPQCTDCTAAPGSYCEAGSSYGSSAAGTTCPLGYFCLGGAQDKQLCTVAAGSFCPPATLSADGAVCPAGFWCAGGPNDKTACAGGTYAATQGSTSVAACSDCTVGTFSSAGSSGCTKCAPGTVAPALGAATCDKCEPGKFAVSVGSAYCTSCPTGKTSEPGSVSVEGCNVDANGTMSVTLTETVRFVVSLPMTAAEFDDGKQQSFKEAIARTAGQAVRADHVIIDKVEEMSTAERRLLAQGVRVAVSVNAVDKNAADAITVRLTVEAINKELDQAGLPSASLLEAPTVVNREAEGTSALDSQDAASAGGASGTAVAVGIVVPVAVIMLACAGWYFVRIRQKGVTVEATGVTAGDDAKTDYVPPALSGVDPALIVDESKVTLGRVLGAGGSGVVKQGTLELRRGRSVDVAVKMISTGDERLFESEVANLIKASRNCSGVAKIHGVCQKQGSFCIVMKLYPKTVAQVLRENPSGLPAARIIKYLRQLCQTLRELHDKGIAHRDLKPHNIFIDEHDCAVVGDFGIAKVYETTVAAGNKSTHVIQGTYNYMPPEAFDEDAFGHVTLKTDVWSFGACLLEMVTGKPPYHHLRPPQIMNHLVNLQRAPEVPDASPFAALLLLCFDFDQSRRPDAAELFTRVLELEQELLDARRAEVATERTRWASDGLGSEKLMEVPPASEEFNSIAAQVLRTMPRAVVERIERVENATLHESFLLQVSTLKQQMGAEWEPALMRRLLFHGTSAVEAIVNSVDGHGFLPLLAGTSTGAIWGNGTYFARDAKYSDDYARSLGGSGQKQMLLVDVLVGRFAQGKEGMKVCPLLPGAEFARYNSLVDRPTDPSIFVVQHSNQAYPSYLITYRLE